MKQRSPFLDKQVIIYFAIILTAVGFIIYSARYVLFRPWTARRWVSTAAIDENLFTVGGINNFNILEDDIIQINLAENTLKRVAKLPSPRYAVSTAAYEESVYIVGGYDFDDYLDDILKYDTRTGEISVIGHLPEPRAFGAMVSVPPFLYYFHGWTGKEVAPDILRINPVDGRVTTLESPVEPLQLHSAAAVGNLVYIIGGENLSKEYVDTIYEIDMTVLKVIRTAQLPSSRGRVPAASAGKEIYLVGGWAGEPLSDVIRLDTEKLKFTPEVLGELGDSNYDLSLAVFGTHLYLIGGTEERFERQIRVLSINTDTLQTESRVFKSFAWW